MNYGLCYVALSEKEQCGTRLTGYAADKALFHFIAWEERMTCPWYLCQAVGTEMPLVTHEGFPAVAADIRKDELHEFVQGFEVQALHWCQGKKRQLSP